MYNSKEVMAEVVVSPHLTLRVFLTAGEASADSYTA